MARLHLHQGDGEARPVAETALAVARKYRMTHHIADSLSILGEIEMNAGRYTEAVGYLRESVALWRTRGWLRFKAAALILLGHALIGLKDREAAAAVLREAEELFTQAADTAKAQEAVALLNVLNGSV